MDVINLPRKGGACATEPHTVRVSRGPHRPGQQRALPSGGGGLCCPQGECGGAGRPQDGSGAPGNSASPPALLLSDAS